MKLGLDLEGGVSITYPGKGTSRPSLTWMIQSTSFAKACRSQYSTEATVYQEGEDRISIEDPGVKDANKIMMSWVSPVPCIILSGEKTVKAIQTTVWIWRSDTNWTRQLKELQGEERLHCSEWYGC